MTQYRSTGSKVYTSFGQLHASEALTEETLRILQGFMKPNTNYRVHTLASETRRPYVTPTLTQLTKAQAEALIKKAEEQKTN